MKRAPASSAALAVVVAASLAAVAVEAPPLAHIC